MKRRISWLVILGMISGSAFVYAASEVTSVNIVGYQKITCEKGKLHLVSTAFNSPTGGVMRSADVFGSQLPNGSSIYAYDTVSKTYKIDNKSFSGWGTNIVYDGGMGFWIQVPSSAASNSYQVTLMGEVPMESVSSNTVANGLTLMGYPYTASVLWTNTSLAKSAINGDALYVFNSSNGNYTVYNRGFSGWGASGNALVITPDMGFWYKTAASQHVVVEDRPYNP